MITHSAHILYVDEVGNNTNQRDDGHKGGQNMLLSEEGSLVLVAQHLMHIGPLSALQMGMGNLYCVI
jgi:hypothetical protein